MEKVVYLLHPGREWSGAQLREGLVSEVAKRLRAEGAHWISVNVADEAVLQGKSVTISHSDPPIRAALCFWLENSDDRAQCEASLRPYAEKMAGYLVAESRPLIHERPLGSRSPGCNLVTRIFKRPDLSQEDFIALWNHEHRKVAVETQSTFGYVRNAVLRALGPDSLPCDGVVEESFPIEALTDPHVWYACDSEEEYKRRLQRMMDSVNAFLDLAPLESVPMSEYWLG